MNFGKKEAPTQTTQSVLSPEQRELMDLAMPGVRSFAATVPKRYQGSGVAGFDPAQQQGQEMALQAAGAQGTVADNAANTSNYWTSGNVWDPANNPALKGAVDAAVRPVTEQYNETVMPAIRGGAMQAGQQFGGSRRGVAEGLAARDYTRNVGDTASKVVNDNYQTNVNAQLRALGLAPTTQAALTQPAVTTSGVGDVRQALQQALLSENVSNFNYDQLAPFLQSKELMSLLTGLPGGSTVSTGSVPSGNPLTGALGGAMSGASLGSAIMPGIGTGLGAAAGGLLGWLGS